MEACKALNENKLQNLSRDFEKQMDQKTQEH